MGRESKAVGLLQAAESDFEGVGDLNRLLGFVCTYDWAIAWTIIVFMKSDQWSESFHSEVFHCLMSFSLRSAVQVSCQLLLDVHLFQVSRHHMFIDSDWFFATRFIQNSIDTQALYLLYEVDQKGALELWMLTCINI